MDAVKVDFAKIDALKVQTIEPCTTEISANDFFTEKTLSNMPELFLSLRVPNTDSFL
jgi:hypothetical protein